MSPAARGPARQPRPVRQGGRRVPGHRRRRARCRRCSPTCRPRTSYGNGPRRGHPDRGRLGQAADRAPRQGPRVGRGLPGRRRATAGSRSRRVADQVARRSCRPAPSAARRRPRPARRCRAGRPRTLRRVRRGGAATHEQTEELRLGYVAVTRARHRLVVSSLLLEPPPGRPRWALRLPADAARDAGTLGVRARALARQAGQGAANPLAAAARRAVPGRWRRTPARSSDGCGPPSWSRAGRGRAPGRRAGAPTAADAEPASSTWSRRPGRRVGRGARAAARRGPAATGRQSLGVPLPSSLSATALARLRDDPDVFAARPGPADAAPAVGRRRGSAPGSTPGSRRASGSSSSSTPTTCPAAADADIDDEDDLQELIGLFEEGPFARPDPGAPSRRRSRWCWPARWSAAASTRSTPTPRGRRLPRRRLEDQPRRRPPTRSSSRSTGVAWAELTGVPLERVRAAFYYVRTGDLVEPAGLDGREELEALLRRESPQEVESLRRPGACDSLRTWRT